MVKSNKPQNLINHCIFKYKYLFGGLLSGSLPWKYHQGGIMIVKQIFTSSSGAQNIKVSLHQFK